MLRSGCSRILGLGQQGKQAQSQALLRFYHERVVDHYNNPRNVGSFDKNDPTSALASLALQLAVMS
ncbi:Iron-sulfur cluster assembly protein 1 [Vitis vinifera]|uniref:Iron-sulfur cluster assembly protein 1 n=1 Tax=Vitis vinifera TaxID=29760 RepID=A0A438J646_VITVI|nr:Iron-sulfur cluster assembly protein 1 [Vitis vinifera]